MEKGNRMEWSFSLREKLGKYEDGWVTPFPKPNKNSKIHLLRASKIVIIRKNKKWNAYWDYKQENQKSSWLQANFLV